MEQALAKSENEQLLSTLKKDIQRLESDLKNKLANDPTSIKIDNILDSLNRITKIIYQLKKVTKYIIRRDS